MDGTPNIDRHSSTTADDLEQKIFISTRFTAKNIELLTLCLDVLQRQCADADTHADYWRSDSGAGADPGRGSRDAGWIQHQRDAGAQKSLPRRADRRRRHRLRSIQRVWHSLVFADSL